MDQQNTEREALNNEWDLREQYDKEFSDEQLGYETLGATSQDQGDENSSIHGLELSDGLYSHSLKKSACPWLLGNCTLDREQLCRFCKNIHLKVLFDGTGCAFHSNFEEIRASARSCLLCRFIEASGWKYHIPMSTWSKNDGAGRKNLKRLKRGRLYHRKRLDKDYLAYRDDEGITLLGLFLETDDGTRKDTAGFKQQFGFRARNQLHCTDSAASFGSARQWLQNCDKHHSCHNTSKSASCAASRIIDVHAFPSSCLDVRLVDVDASLAKNKYIALSHCWGGEQTFCTETTTLAERKNRIRFDDLPRTFRDAIKVTRELGIRYIWIDSICIVQDDGSDWAHEAAKMSDVYSECYVMVAADSSLNSQGGLFNTKSVMQDDPPLGQHVIVPARLPNGAECRLWVSSAEQDIVHSEISTGILSSRGWTLQERILSSRILHFTSKQVIWECQKGYEAEDCIPLNPNPTVGGDVLSAMSAGLRKRLRGGDRAKVLTTWYDMLEHYSGRNLTFNSDKLPALSGLARWTSVALKSRYLAGMWEDDLAWALSWSTDFNNVTMTEHSGYPSFSWAASHGKVWFGASARKHFSKSIEIETISVEPETVDPFGRVRAGSWIKISGFTSVWSRRSADSPSFVICNDDDSPSFELAENLPTDPPLVGERSSSSINLELGYIDYPNGKREVVLLVLEPLVDQTECFVRKSLVTIDYWREPDLETPGWFEHGKYRRACNWKSVKLF